MFKTSKDIYAGSAGAKCADEVVLSGMANAAPVSADVADCVAVVVDHFSGDLPSDPGDPLYAASIISKYGDRNSSSGHELGDVGMEVPKISDPAHGSGVANDNSTNAISALDVNDSSNGDDGNPIGTTPTISNLRSEYSEQRPPISSPHGIGDGDFPPLRSVSGTRFLVRESFGRVTFLWLFMPTTQVRRRSRVGLHLDI